MEIELPAFGWQPRTYQLPLWRYLERGGTEAVAVWHRRSGKDEIGLHRAAIAAHERVANYWHLLPEATQARKAIWSAINPHSGRRRIDEAFPLALRKTTREQEMFIEFKNGSSWQVVGSDNFNSLVGSTPAGVVYSEWSLANPAARAYLRPIITENNGWELLIYTPRGRNHGLSTLRVAQQHPKSFAQVLTAAQTGTISAEVLADERAHYLAEYGDDQGEAFFNQEYNCDFNAPLLGAILGRSVARAEAEGRITESVDYDLDGAPVEISSDIGFRDTAAWWFWQPTYGGFNVFDYDQDTGLDADDWIARLQERLTLHNATLGKIWLPHDARAKTFQSKHSVVERFLTAFGSDKVAIVPVAAKQDRINAGRQVIGRCAFNATRCEKGLDGLRSWQYEFNEDTRTFGKEPRHDWASHPSDAFTYGCQIMLERKAPPPKAELRYRGCIDTSTTINDILEDHYQQFDRRERI